MTRAYTLKRRAESQAATRRRIVEAAVELHSTLGPARTTFTLLAERAGVQRHTLYAHFPDERTLQLACSGLTIERDPMPDAAAWQAIADRHARLRTGLRQLYGWYERNARLAACVLRDAEHHEVTRETVELRFGPSMTSYRNTLGAGLTARQEALLRLALSFNTWRTLALEAKLDVPAAADAMAGAIEAAT
ncbi:MAG: helix-turn-helix domain-containing protein [Hyphomicrobiaceae bacterium]|nr:helix-turn-helix domain-containing protein [Hyphomicrobiaceae bacterium]